MNSRERRTPKRGRNSSRNLVWIFLVGGAEGDVAAVAVFDAEEVVAVGGVPPGLLEQVERYERGHEDLFGARGGHLFTDDLLDALEAAEPGREVGVAAGAELADEPGAEHELVGGDLGVGGGLAERGDQRLGPECGHGGFCRWDR